MHLRDQRGRRDRDASRILPRGLSERQPTGRLRRSKQLAFSCRKAWIVGFDRW